MGKRIFISYKFKDNDVAYLKKNQAKGLASLLYPNSDHTKQTALGLFSQTTARDYVDHIQEIIADTDHYDHSEKNDDDLSHLTEESIQKKLYDKIHYTTVTFVLISKGMKDLYKSEKDQWIPREIAYSLREQSRSGRTSSTNAILAIVIPDQNNSYSYFIQDNSCPYCNCQTLHTNNLFQIMSRNMFNRKNKTFNTCSNHGLLSKVEIGFHSYIYSVKWHDFIANPEHYISIALHINDNIDDYVISKEI